MRPSIDDRRPYVFCATCGVAASSHMSFDEVARVEDTIGTDRYSPRPRR